MTTYKKGDYIEIGFGEYNVDEDGIVIIDDGGSFHCIVDKDNISDTWIEENFFEPNVIYIERIDMSDEQSVQWANTNGGLIAALPRYTNQLK